jgi:hypothetical protein
VTGGDPEDPGRQRGQQGFRSDQVGQLHTLQGEKSGQKRSFGAKFAFADDEAKYGRLLAGHRPRAIRTPQDLDQMEEWLSKEPNSAG